MPDPLDAVSPLDGRYAEATAPLRPYASELALMRARARVEVEYVLALAELDEVDLALDESERAALHAIYGEFSLDDARRIKRLEQEGDEERPATKHDVKAVEYWLQDAVEQGDLEEVIPWIHFGLTSEDVNNLAYRLNVRGALREVLIPALVELQATLQTLAQTHRNVPMMARTHGQPASPTTFGKELGVYADRTRRGIGRVDRAAEGLCGKFGGATGTLAAHHTVLPTVDWRAFARRFVEGFDLTYLPLTTQVNPGDDLARLFDGLSGVNGVLIDLDRDMWRYISDGYLRQAGDGDEVGSSTMPHKVNPIEFENAEGNLERARSDLRFLADYLTTSRLQRDLSDSTVTRTVGTGLAHCLLGYSKTSAGLAKVEPDPDRLAADLDASPEVLAEAVQTALRRIGDRDAYERVKEATRGVAVDVDTYTPLIERVRAVDPDLADRLDRLSPREYTGLAAAMVDELPDE